MFGSLLHNNSYRIGATALVLTLGGSQLACNPVKSFQEIVARGAKSLADEDLAYRNLTNAAPTRSDATVGALQQWNHSLSAVNKVLSDAQSRLGNAKKAAKIRANASVQNELASFKQRVDVVLSRNYGDATLKLVAPWNMESARKIADQSSNELTKIAAAYGVIFAAQNPHSGRDFTIAVIQDEQILDTRQPCIDKVAQLTQGQAKNSYCVDAAATSCGHQTDLGCVANGVAAAIPNNLCPEVKTVTALINEGETCRDRQHESVGSGEELQGCTEGKIVQIPNPHRVVQEFCIGEYNGQTESFGSRSGLVCGNNQIVRIYGFDENRHVTVEVLGVTSPVTNKNLNVNLYVDGQSIGGKSLPNGGATRFTIEERAFQPGTNLRLSFLQFAQVVIGESANGQVKKKTVHWNVETAIPGQDIPFLFQKEVIVTKYTPNSWVKSIVNSCAARTPILK